MVLLAVGAFLYGVSWLVTSGSDTDETAADVSTEDSDDAQSTSTTASSEPADETTSAPPTTAPATVTTTTTAVVLTSTIGAELEAADDLSQITAVVQSLGLRDTLDGAGPFTFFAPPNAVFASIDRDLLTAVTADEDLLRAVAMNHLVEGETSSLRELDAPLVTMGGAELIFEVIDGDLFLQTESGPVAVTESRIATDNGVIHGIDGLVLPDSATTPPASDDDEPADDPASDDEPTDEPVDESDDEPTGTPNETVDAIGALLALDPVQFDDSSADIKAESLATLDQVVAILEADQATELEIAGHTDDIGPADGNQRWSERRANSVRDYLIAQGVDADRLVAVGYGENNPVADNTTEEGRAENRRIEFTLL
ncbi:MAG: OmpA family protein [Acidimicrobiales bacterium]|nr:OmpA family protein [Acidimicrobiales bacterium]RZV48483.1 MAG: hypothetical protein EX269_01490 [Acidimicrobiales bacterium]